MFVELQEDMHVFKASFTTLNKGFAKLPDADNKQMALVAVEETSEHGLPVPDGDQEAMEALQQWNLDVADADSQEAKAHKGKLPGLVDERVSRLEKH